MPPKKKYRTIIMPQSGVLSMTASVSSSAVTEREERAQPDEDGRADREERVDHDVALRDLRVLRKVVRGRFRQQQKERVQAAQEALLIGPVELGVLEAHRLQGLDTLAGLRDELVAEPELDGLGRTGLGAGGAEAVVDAVVAERALPGGPGVLVEADDAERARRHAVATPVAGVLVDVERAEFRPVDGAGRFHDANQANHRVREVGVVLVGVGPLRLLHAELVPLLARDLTGPAADAEGGVREHRERARHRYTTPFFTLQTKAFVS